eukprot:scaffold270323_cov32-Prasinocladus_malaysianus.AAC.3
MDPHLPRSRCLRNRGPCAGMSAMISSVTASHPRNASLCSCRWVCRSCDKQSVVIAQLDRSRRQEPFLATAPICTVSSLKFIVI